MQRDLIAKGRTLGGSSDLTLLAPIKPGFIDSLESVTYKTRVKRVLAALHAGRQTGVEYAAARLLSDAVERVGAIQSVRVAVLEPEDKVLLVVTFDGNWESYIRVLWDKVGTLLDVIFCSTVDYVPAFGNSFDEWHGWAQRVQVESSFFYGPPDFTSRDTFHHRRNERMRQRGEGCELNELRSVAPSAEEAVQRTVHPLGDPPKDDFPVFFPPNYLRTGQERLRGGLQSLAGLYRLTDLFRPSTPDGEVLRMAAIDLLLEFVQMWDTSKDQINKAKAGRFARQIDWLFPAGTVVGPNVRKRPPDAATQPDKVDACVLADIQGGIVRGYAELTHGVALLLAFENAQAASLFLAWLENNVSHGNTTTIATPAQPACNAAFTSSGLRAMGHG